MRGGARRCGPQGAAGGGRRAGARPRRRREPAGPFSSRHAPAARRRPLPAPRPARAPSKDSRPRAEMSPLGRREPARNARIQAGPTCRAPPSRGLDTRGCRQGMPAAWRTRRPGLRRPHRRGCRQWHRMMPGGGQGGGRCPRRQLAQEARMCACGPAPASAAPRAGRRQAGRGCRQRPECARPNVHIQVYAGARCVLRQQGAAHAWMPPET